MTINTAVWIGTLSPEGLHLVTETVAELSKTHGEWIDMHVVAFADKEYDEPVLTTFSARAILKLVPQSPEESST